MAKTTLAQDEPYLKQLDQALKEIGDLHQRVHDALLASEASLQEAYGLINVSWPKVTKLFIVLECLKTNRRDFDRGQQ